MTRGRSLIVLALWLTALLAVGGRPAGAQSLNLVVGGITNDSTSPAPTLSIAASGLEAFPGPLVFVVEMALNSAFQGPFFLQVAQTPNVSFHLDSLLAEHERVYFRVRAVDPSGNTVAQNVQSYPVHSWLHLIEPARSVGTPLTTRTPRFVWSSPPISVPPGLWSYEVDIINSASGLVEHAALGLHDTTYVFPDSLQANTSYHWQVLARAENGLEDDQVRITSPASFVITSSDQPSFTLLYQNFPNPFGGPSRSTCFWFDLAHPSTVSLVVYDIRLRMVRTIVPGPIGSGRLPVGAYGRQNVSAQTGCDDRLSWDGTDDAGRPVRTGVYVAVFRADGVQQSVKILYRGQ